MNDILELECILKRNRYPFVYNFGFLMIIIIIIFLYIINTYKYQGYYVTSGVVKNGFVELLVLEDELKYTLNNEKIILDGNEYKYSVNKISDDVFIDDNYNKYRYVYILIDEIYSVDNYVYQVKIKKEKKALANYLLDYIKGGKNGVN